MEAYDANYVGGDINGGIADLAAAAVPAGHALEPVLDVRPVHLPLLVVFAARRRRPRHGRPARSPQRIATPASPVIRRPTVRRRRTRCPPGRP